MVSMITLVLMCCDIVNNNTFKCYLSIAQRPTLYSKTEDSSDFFKEQYTEASAHIYTKSLLYHERLKKSKRETCL